MSADKCWLQTTVNLVSSMFLFIVTMCFDCVRSPYFAVVMLYHCSKLASLRRQVLVSDLHPMVWREGEKAIIVSFPMEVEIMSELGPGDLAWKSMEVTAKSTCKSTDLSILELSVMSPTAFR